MVVVVLWSVLVVRKKVVEVVVGLMQIWRWLLGMCGAAVRGVHELHTTKLAVAIGDEVALSTIQTEHE